MKYDIILELGDNYNENDSYALDNIIDRVTAIARNLSNSTSEQLNPYIITCVKAEYLSRGGEGLNSLNESGKTSTFTDNIDKMKKDIISAGLRRCY